MYALLWLLGVFFTVAGLRGLHDDNPAESRMGGCTMLVLGVALLLVMFIRLLL